MTTEQKRIQKELLKKEDEIIRSNKLFCAENNIHWTRKHDTRLRNAMREFFLSGISPIIKELMGYK